MGELWATSKDDAQIKHLMELSDRILNSEVPMKEADRDLEKSWSDSHYENS